ncbi:MAG TPA: hypothetical protein DIT18_16250 [Pseudomonas sp.]|nr:hypothetical protein [Pseudomonas sp.]
MDVKTLATIAGVTLESVIDCEAVKGGHVLRIDLKKEPALHRLIKARSTMEAQLPDGDVFDVNCVLDGSPHAFTVESMDKYRTYGWVDGSDEGRVPAWRLRAQVYPPHSAYGASIEYIGLLVFDRHTGTVYDLSQPNDHMQRPSMSYVLGYLSGADILKFIIGYANAGNLEVNHDFESENQMRLTGAFADVRVNMPNCHEHLEQAPDREFVVQLPSGFYNLTGSL